MKSKQVVHQFPKLSIKSNTETPTITTALFLIASFNKPMEDNKLAF